MQLKIVALEIVTIKNVVLENIILNIAATYFQFCSKITGQKVSSRKSQKRPKLAGRNILGGVLGFFRGARMQILLATNFIIKF